MTDAFHRIVTGAVVSRRELVIAAWVVIFWIVIDVIQFIGWVVDKWPTPDDIPL
jgi:hypothetical protein